MKITQLLLWTQENQLSEKFYKKLGFDVISSDDEVSVVGLQGFQITLVNMRDEAMFTNDSLAGEKGKGMYIYVAADDVDNMYDQLVRKGIQPATKPKDWRWGNREFIIKDPDGYKLCFWQKIAK